MAIDSGGTVPQQTPAFILNWRAPLLLTQHLFDGVGSARTGDEFSLPPKLTTRAQTWVPLKGAARGWLCPKEGMLKRRQEGQNRTDLYGQAKVSQQTPFRQRIAEGQSLRPLSNRLFQATL